MHEAAHGVALGLEIGNAGGIERRLRRPETDTSSWRERAWATLRSARPRPLEALAGNGEFALVLVRRDSSGDVAPVAGVPDSALLERAIRRATA